MFKKSFKNNFVHWPGQSILKICSLNSAESGERSLLTLGCHCLPCYMQNKAEEETEKRKEKVYVALMLYR